jgi:HD-like signal output (HDOD) protein
MNQAGNPDLRKLLSGAQLPALPHSAIKILELARNPENGPAEFAIPIEADPGLTGQVLRFVNSSYFGFAREISSVRLAITMVGVRTVKNFALWSAVFSLMPNPKCGVFDLRSLWQDSLRRALFARSMAKLLGLRETEEAFAAALLQDMAVPLLAKELAGDYRLLLERRERGKKRLSDLEFERFGWNHAKAGAAMARQWNLPAEFAALIEEHVATDRLADAGTADPLKSAVRLSSLLPAAGDDAWHEGAQFEHAYQQLAPAGGPGVVEFLGLLDGEFKQFAPVLNVSTAAKSLVDSFNEFAATASAAS